MGARPGTLVLLRHGESTANAARVFTGVLDVPLAAQGVRESRRAGRLLAAEGPDIARIFTSTLRRAYDTASIVAVELRRDPAEVRRDWRLNERNYGALTGCSKRDVLRRYRRSRFSSWHRSVDVAPPPLSEALYRRLASEPPFDRLPAEALTRTESLRDVIARVAVFFDRSTLPALVAGENVLIVSHGNTLRALCAHLDALADAEVEALNIPTGHPLVYDFSPDLRPVIRGGRYLDEEAAMDATARLAAQGGT